MTSYGLYFGRTSTSWKAYQVYFQTDPASYPSLFGLGRNRRFNTETFSVYGATLPYFGPWAVYRVWVQYGHVLGLEHDPSTLVVILPCSYIP
jgi:hypothetical protein